MQTSFHYIDIAVMAKLEILLYGMKIAKMFWQVQLVDKPNQRVSISYSRLSLRDKHSK